MLNFKQSPESVANPEIDPIEESPVFTLGNISRMTLPQARRRPLRSIQQNILLPQQIEKAPLQDFKFRALKNTLPLVPRYPAMRYTAREGFEDHEMGLPPKLCFKRPYRRRTEIPLHCLQLVNADDLKQLSLAPSTFGNHHEDDPIDQIPLCRPLDDNQPVGKGLESQSFDPEIISWQREMSLHAQECPPGSSTCRPPKSPRSSSL